MNQKLYLIYLITGFLAGVIGRLLGTVGTTLTAVFGYIKAILKAPVKLAISTSMAAFAGWH